MRYVIGLCAVLYLVPGCGLLLDFDPPDRGPDAGLVAADGSFADADRHRLDASYDASHDSSLDSSLDGSQDGSSDADLVDAFVGDSGPPDADMDAGPSPGCGGALGLCLELHEEDPARDTAYWGYDVIFTRPGGEIFGTDWAPMPCIGGIMTVGPGTTQCLLPIPPPGEPVVGSPLTYAYPVMNDGTPWCTMDACPGFYMAYRVWIDGVPIPTEPALGYVNLERRTGTPYGTLMCLRITP